MSDWWRDEVSLGDAGIGEASLLATLVFIALIWYFDSDASNFWSQFFTLATEASISVIVTLFVIEKALKEDRRRHSHEERIYRYETILNLIRYITYQAFSHSKIWISPDECSIRWDLIDKVWAEHSADKSAIFRKIANKIYYEYGDANSRMRQEEKPVDSEEWSKKWKENRELDKKLATEHFLRVDRQLNEMRTSLIPRAIDLSDSSELQKALYSFVDILRGYEINLISSPDTVGTNLLRELILAASDAYDAVEKEYQKERLQK